MTTKEFAYRNMNTKIVNSGYSTRLECEGIIIPFATSIDVNVIYSDLKDIVVSPWMALFVVDSGKPAIKIISTQF